MIIFRPISHADLESFVSICSQAHLGFYTLPKNRQLIEHRLNRSLHSFAKEVTAPEQEIYLFVAEDSETKELLGVSGIDAITGGFEPLYFFRKELIEVNSHLPAVVKSLCLLTPVSYPKGPSEVCALFVLPPYRNSGVGRLLSFARFLFIRAFPQRFTETLSAELRGVIDENNSSPFWEGIGRHFFDLPLNQVHAMLEYGRSFLSHFLPKQPIYLSLLPKEVQAAAGEVDSLARGAFAMLQKLGFRCSGEIDVLDGGPKLLATTENITVIKNSIIVTIAEIKETLPLETEECLISNSQLDFRACYGRITFIRDSEVCLERATAEALKIELKSKLYIYFL